MNQAERIVSSGWRDAASTACASGYQVEDQGAGNFCLRPGASIQARQHQALARLQTELSAVSAPAAAFMIHDVLLLGNGFIVSTQNGLVRESRYLTNNVERRVELSLRDEPVMLDDSVTWIVAGNASSRNNYWHWFAQILPAVLHCRDYATTLGKYNIGVVTEPLKDWQVESLLVMGIARGLIVEINQFQNAQAKTCLYSSFLSGFSVFSNNRYRKEISDTFIRWAGAPDVADVKVAISRRDTKKRRLLNEDLLHTALEADGFHIVTGGTMSLREQIQTFHAASVIVAPHGAGSTNVLFGRPGARYVELAQLSYPNSGPLSLCKTSEMLAWIDLFEDDGMGQSTDGWTVSTEVVRDTIADAESLLS